jgi:hypothetical protein
MDGTVVGVGSLLPSCGVVGSIIIVWSSCIFAQDKVTF